MSIRHATSITVIALTMIPLLLVVGCEGATPVPVLPTATAPPASVPPTNTATATPPAASATPNPTVATPLPVMELTSTAFDHGKVIPVKHTCDGADVSPPLAWSDPPPDTQSFALIVDNPDAVGTVGKPWVQWILYNIPAQARSLPEAIPPDAELADGSRQGRNTEEWLRYVGPCPPFTQRYYFRLYALDTMLDLDAGATKEELVQAMEGHILAQGELMGKYKRR